MAGGNIMEAIINKDGFIQITMIVKDIEKAVEGWCTLLGIEPPPINLCHMEGGENYTYRGQPVSCDIKACNIPMNGWLLELHEVISGDSTFKEFMEKHGNGVHHIGFEVGNRRDEVIRRIGEMGFDVNRTFGAYPGSSWTIVDSEDLLGVNLNIKPVR